MAADDGRVVSNFIVQALQGQPITIYGKGTQTRSFCYVDDLLDGLMLLMATPREVSFPVNLGNDSEFTIAELADFVLAKTGSTSKIVHSPIPVDDSRPRMTEDLKAVGVDAGHRRVGRLMRENGTIAARKRKFRATADSDNTFNIAPNLLDRDFTAEGPNQNWAGDISYIGTRGGWRPLWVMDRWRRQGESGGRP